MPLGLFFAFINIDNIADCLECVERNADGEKELESGQHGGEAQDFEGGLRGGGEKAEVFEGEEDAEVYD